MQLSFDPSKQYRNIFPTPLGMFQLPDSENLSPRICDVILARMEKEQGIDRSNRGGWHSDDQLLNWPELQFADLGDTFRSAVSHMIATTSGTQKFNVALTLGAWANVNGPGNFNGNHIHPGNHWSGCLYVKAPDFRNDPVNLAGHIEFMDPRGAVSMIRMPGMSDTFSLPPQTGAILVFPSWLYHCVNTFSIDTTRISIAFNARIDRFEPA